MSQARLRAEAHPGPTETDEDLGRSTARWVVSLFVAAIVLQRLSLPGGIITVLQVLAYGWCAYGLWRGLLVVDLTRMRLFAAAFGLTAAAALAQGLFVERPQVSVTSWGFFLAVWLPATLRIVDRSRATLLAAMQGCVRAGAWLAGACVAMLLVQLVGVRYVDYVALVVPKSLLVQGYVITYPIVYDSPIYRSNAWIGLEPSVISLQLGCALVLALLVRARARVLLLLIVGMATTVSGSGIFVAAIAIAVMLLYPIRRQLLRYVLASVVAVGLLMLTEIGQQLGRRAAEATIAGSSTSLRAIEPYVFLWPTWATDMNVVLFGMGAGSSQKLIDDTNRAGLLVTTPIKIFFDYGIVAGVALAAFLLFCYLRGPSRSLSAGLLLSSWVLQPGTTTFVLVLPTLLFITWWAPWPGRVIEADPLVASEGLP